MGELYAEFSSLIDADPVWVYDVLADYRGGHSQILPADFFADYRVIEGGRGAGTVVTVKARMLGQVRGLRMTVSEPQPGRVLMETETTSGMATSFTVEAPDEFGSAQTRVTIATRWMAQPGFAGILEGWLVPRILRKMFAQELMLLAEFLRR